VSSSPTRDHNQAASDSGTEVVMPQMGVSVAEGTIAAWLKRPGEQVAADEPICEVTTDKIDVEIPAPASGVMTEVLVEEGETVPVGTVLARIGSSADAGSNSNAGTGSDADRATAGPAPAATPPAAAEGGTESDPDRAAAGPVADATPPAAADAGPAGAPHPRHPREQGNAETDSVPSGGDARGEIDRSSFYSPVVRRIAAEEGVDLDAVEGHGVGGRVRKADLLAHIRARREAPAPDGNGHSRPLHTESPYRPEPDAGATAAGRPAAPADVEELVGPTRREAMDPMRKAIARHMVESRRTAAHCTTIVEADFSAVAGERTELKETMARRGVPLTYLAFVARAVVEGLGEHPVLNASVEGEELVLHDDVNLGIAVALESGLVVPVIRKAQRLSLEGMAAAIAELAAQAREGRLEPDDLVGGTFTITNPGQFGAVLATPIINQPQVGILDLEAIVRRPVVVDGPDGSEAIAIRPMSYLCMSWDHRALDGAEAARFLAGVRARIEGWRAER
jgi:pyruvate dehydrogenase E2 component (dihydrolipoamide acetyltransferase)